MLSVNRGKQSCGQAFGFPMNPLAGGLPWPLTPSCRPGNLRNSGAHGKPVAQSPSQIRLLTSRNKQVTKVSGWQLGEVRGLNNQSFWLVVIGRIGVGLKGLRSFSTWRMNGHWHSAHGMRNISGLSAAVVYLCHREEGLCRFSFRSDIYVSSGRF